MHRITTLKCSIIVFAAIFLAACQDTSDFYLLEQDQTKKHQNGQKLSDYRGKWLLINFWAEWCAPCLKEIPELNKLYQARDQLNLELIGVSYDPLSHQQINAIVNKWSILYPIMATEPVPILPFSLPNSLPGNYLINPDGEVVAKLKGEQSYESITKLLITLEK